MNVTWQNLTKQHILFKSVHRRVNDYRYKTPTSSVPQLSACSSEMSCRQGDWCVVVFTMATERLIVVVNHGSLPLFRPSLPPSLVLSAPSLLDDEQGRLVSLCISFLHFLLFSQATTTFDLLVAPQVPLGSWLFGRWHTEQGIREVWEVNTSSTD